jgi:hypothetical protein
MASKAPRSKPRALLLTREYPPEIYGGAGVHVDYLSGEALFSWRRVAAEVVLLYRSLSEPERHGG